MLVLHSLVTGFLMGWRTIDDSMPNFLLATKSAHCLYLILGTYYWMYVKAFENFAKYVKKPSTEFLNLIFTCFVIDTLGLIALDTIILGVKLIPTTINCYKNPPSLPLPLECDYGNEKTIFTITTAVSGSHIILESIILILTIMIHTGISKSYKTGEGWWYPFFRNRRDNNNREMNDNNDENGERNLLKEFQGHIEPLAGVIYTPTNNTNDKNTTTTTIQPHIQRLDSHVPTNTISPNKYKCR